MKRIFRRRKSGNGDDEESRGPAPGARRGVYGLVGVLATLVDVIVGLVCLLIVAGIVLFVLGANEDNAIVGAVLDAAEFLVGPFRDIFERDDEKQEVAINWGIAVIAYFVVGRVISSLLRRGEE